ncbi:Uma2 family endonuclease [Amycolatopsis keratiniphila]|uniref:Putative restriction endonuclease domain-containing protein n=1 Tax=Amycolatopsis keratiniphila subsp. keratiniphila TaxID=227715 RepID=A0A1W2M2Z9_9PSEU|nr:Uma2 family endonuclease [Amycolatopsis keratiniphila]ONF73920.1 hypothetical protein AVR91_0204100 [Amycolatopsis keratiniphila subsp. keratiniphila]
MSAVADLQHPLGPHTVDEWRTADRPDDGGRLELIWGYWHVSPPPGGPHQYATGALYRALWDAVKAAGRTDLYPVLGVGVEITTALRTALIPDVALLRRPPTATSFPAEDLELAVEVWSPGNTAAERETKVAAYAEAGIPFLWLLEFARGGRVELRALQLHSAGGYRERPHRTAGAEIELAGPVPVRIALAELTP